MIYTASRTRHAHLWRALRASGTPIHSTWIDEAGPGETEDFADLWDRCIAEASTARVLLCYREPGEILKGAYVEVGAALAHRVPILAVGAEEFSFTRHRLVTNVPTLAEALAMAGAACRRTEE